MFGHGRGTHVMALENVNCISSNVLLGLSIEEVNKTFAVTCRSSDILLVLSIIGENFCGSPWNCELQKFKYVSRVEHDRGKHLLQPQEQTTAEFQTSTNV